MSFIIAASTDVGNVKEINQDAYSAKRAQTPNGEIAMLVMCDGMGGFESGELASASVINAFSKWFANYFSQLNMNYVDSSDFAIAWNDICTRANTTIAKYGNSNGIKLGTTLTAVLLFGGKYFCVNVGDSRAYMIRDNSITQLTVDHSLVQREIDMGRLRPEDAESHPQRNVLTQCIGCSNNLNPDFFTGEYVPGDVFLLCSDGFRHEVSNDEIVFAFNNRETSEALTNAIDYIIDVDKSRGEADNITGVVAKCL